MVFDLVDCVSLRESLRVYVPSGHGLSNLVSRRRRDAINARAKLVPNIPQSAEWQWVSPMHVFAAPRCRVTLTFDAGEKTLIDPMCLDGDYLSDAALADPQSRFEEGFETCSRSVASPKTPEFRHSLHQLRVRLEPRHQGAMPCASVHT
jgi:hypothetical protein